MKKTTSLLELSVGRVCKVSVNLFFLPKEVLSNIEMQYNFD